MYASTPATICASVSSLHIEAMDKNNVVNNISDKEFNYILEKVLSPNFHLVPSPNVAKLTSAIYMDQFLHEQYAILEFL